VPADPLGRSDFDANKTPNCTFVFTHKISHVVPNCDSDLVSHGCAYSSNVCAHRFAHSTTIKVALYVPHSPDARADHRRADINTYIGTFD
jgi:hypothetical protein